MIGIVRVDGRSVIGDQWRFRVEVFGVDGCLSDVEDPTITVTPPTGGPVTPIPSSVDTGVWEFTYIPAAAGRYLIVASTASLGSGGYGAWADAAATSSGYPLVADVQEYLQEYSWSDEEIGHALAAEMSAQRRRIRPLDVFPDDLREALLRRVQRNLAMRRLPLGTPSGDAEGGGTFIPRTDPEIRRLEAPFRRLTVG